MYRPVQTAIFLIAALLFVSCDSSPNAESEPTGTLEVVTSTTGDSDGYTVTVDGTTESIGADDTTEVLGVSEGSYQAELSDLGDACSVEGDNPRTVNITADQTTSTTFEVSCGPALVNQIAFDTYLDENQEIVVVDPDGSNSERLTDNGTFDAHPIVSPDGTEIAFLSSRNNNSVGENVDLFVMNADGSDVREVTTLSIYYGYMDWSPDGEKLVYGDASNNNDDIYVINVDGSGKSRLTDDPEVDVEPSWSPDGSRIVFASNRDGDYDLYTVDSNGDDLQRLTDDQSDNRQPRWSPDGSEVAFSSDRGGSWDHIYTLEVESGDITQVTGKDASNDNKDRWPTWSPDGSEIAFQSVAFEGTGLEIYKVSADGSGTPEVVTNSFEKDSQRPFWSPAQ